jgi:hypothetical protein
MARCDQCGNDYDKSFEVTMAGRTMTFDSFECAIQALAPIMPALRQSHYRPWCRAKRAPSSAACIVRRRKV